MKKLFFNVILVCLGILNSSSVSAPTNKGNQDNNIKIKIEKFTNDFTFVNQYFMRFKPTEQFSKTESPPWNLEKEKKTFSKENLSSNSVLYEKTIAFIKKHEGFAGGKPYYCVAGYKTIGYGHVIKEKENFGDKITKKQADILLRKDFNKCINLAKKHSNGLSENQLLAIAHFIYAKGIGNYLKSELKKKVDNKENPDDEFLKWCKYHSKKHNGKIIKSKYSLKIRQWEIQMFNGLL